MNASFYPTTSNSGIDAVPKFLIRIQRLTEMVIGHLKNPRTNDQIGQWMPNSTQSSVLSQAKSLIIGEMADNFRAAQVIYYTSEPKQQAWLREGIQTCAIDRNLHVVPSY